MFTHKGKRGIQPAIPVPIKLNRETSKWTIPYTQETVSAFAPDTAIGRAKEVMETKTMEDGYVRFPWLDTGEDVNPYMVDKVVVYLTPTTLQTCKVKLSRKNKFLVRLFNILFKQDPFDKDAGFYIADTLIRGVPIRVVASARPTTEPHAGLDWTERVWSKLDGHERRLVRKRMQELQDKVGTMATVAYQTHPNAARVAWRPLPPTPEMKSALEGFHVDSDYIDAGDKIYFDSVDIACRVVLDSGDPNVLYRVRKGKRYGVVQEEQFIWKGQRRDTEPTHLEVWGVEQPEQAGETYTEWLAKDGDLLPMFEEGWQREFFHHQEFNPRPFLSPDSDVPITPYYESIPHRYTAVDWPSLFTMSNGDEDEDE